MFIQFNMMCKMFLPMLVLLQVPMPLRMLLQVLLRLPLPLPLRLLECYAWPCYAP
nr:MAG TPA: hypothetical protein [Caudoviricetes sp.]